MKKKIQHFRGTEKSPEMFVHRAQLLSLKISRGFSVLIRLLEIFEKVAVFQ